MPDDSATIKQSTKEPLPDIPSSWERFTVMVIFGLLTLYMGYVGNNEAMTGFASTLAVYFLSRQGA